MINKYMGKLSGPLLDRIDINVNIQPLEYRNFKENEKIETSKQIKERVEKCEKRLDNHDDKFYVLNSAVQAY